MSVIDLWLPILLAGLATHILSTLAWMVLPHHKPEWRGLAEHQDEFQDWLHSKQVTAGQYLFPFTQDMSEVNTDAYRTKQSKCRGMLVLWSSVPNMGANIGLTLLFFFVASFSIGYLATLGLERGASFAQVFRFVGTAGLLTHCYGLFPGVFWFRRQIAMDLVDKVAYALVTGAIFAALWPA